MKFLILSVIRSASESCGLNLLDQNEANNLKTLPSFIEYPVEISSVLLARPRIEYQLMKSKIAKINRKLSKTGQNTACRTLRKTIDQIAQPVRLSIIAADEVWLESFVHSLHKALPKNISDEHNNFVNIRVSATEYSGSGTRIIQIDPVYRKTLHLVFTGLVTEDVETPWIMDATINPNWKNKGDTDD